MTPRIALAFFLLFVAVFRLAPAQDQQSTTEQREIEYTNAAEEDKKFDDTILSEEDRPDKEPDQNQVEESYSKYISTSRDLETQVQKAERVDLYAKYISLKDWLPYYPCCPKSQDYECRGVAHRQPCFNHWVNGRREWCCPFWPAINIISCNCSKCVRQCPYSQCFATGSCYRRYTNRTFWAVCYNTINGWGTFRYFNHLLPSSCYCGARC